MTMIFRTFSQRNIKSYKYYKFGWSRQLFNHGTLCLHKAQSSWLVHKIVVRKWALHNFNKTLRRINNSLIGLGRQLPKRMFLVSSTEIWPGVIKCSPQVFGSKYTVFFLTTWKLVKGHSEGMGCPGSFNSDCLRILSGKICFRATSQY